MANGSKHDAVVLYNHKDLAYARELTRALEAAQIDCWFADEDIKPGEPLQIKIALALKNCRAALICVGAASLGRFQAFEWNAVFASMVKGQITGIPVHVGERTTNAPPDIDDIFLDANKAVDLRGAITSSTDWNSLVESLRPPPPEPGDAAAGGVREAPEPSAVEQLARRIVGYSRDQGLNLLIGPTWSDPVVPTPQDVTLSMISKLLQLDGGEREKLAGTPLMPPEQASLAVALSNLGSSEHDEAIDYIVSEFVASRSLGEPQAFESVVELARTVAGATEEGRSGDLGALVMTTNIDLALERAFLVRGCSFVRLVYDVGKKGFWKTDFETPSFDGGRLTLGGFSERLASDLPEKERTTYRDWYAAYVADQCVSFSDFVRVVERNRIIGDYHDRDHEKPSPLVVNQLKADRPILIKLLGSHQVQKSSALSCAKQYRLAMSSDTLQTALHQALLMNPSVIAGYSLCEPVFRLLFETLLKRPFKEATHDRRCVLLELPGQPANTAQALATAVGNATSGRYNNELELQVVADISPVSLLDSLRTAVERRPRESWGPF